MFLEYGIDQDGAWVWIGQAQRGLTSLRCPYCDGTLLARKGEVKEHHFAHAGETCRQVQRDQDAIALPAYDNFNLHLPPRALKALQNFSDEKPYDRSILESHELLTLNKWARNGRGEYELTKKGKLVLGELSLKLFCEFQSPLIVERHAALEAQAVAAYSRADIEARVTAAQNELATIRNASSEPLSGDRYREYDAAARNLGAVMAELKATGTIDLQTALSDLQLFRAQWRRVLTCSLYFLEINGGELYKIGVTVRGIEQRITEIIADLAPHLGDVSIRVLGVWPHRGSVELYFKHCYRTNQHPLGMLTEYFTFDNIAPVLTNLQRMGKEYTLSDLEIEILRGDRSGIEQRIYADTIEQKRRAAIRTSMSRKARRGDRIGRPAGAESLADFLTKPTNVTIAQLLGAGVSIRKTAEITGTSTTTVQKVKAALSQEGSR